MSRGTQIPRMVSCRQRSNPLYHCGKGVMLFCTGSCLVLFWQISFQDFPSLCFALVSLPREYRSHWGISHSISEAFSVFSCWFYAKNLPPWKQEKDLVFKMYQWGSAHHWEWLIGSHLYPLCTFFWSPYNYQRLVQDLQLLQSKQKYKAAVHWSAQLLTRDLGISLVGEVVCSMQFNGKRA